MLHTAKEVIEDIKAGKVVIVFDHESRENEGDFITAAENVTPELINFMITHGRGLLCCAITEQRSTELSLPLMIERPQDDYKTAFTVSVDLIGNGCTTGISASDRAKTVRALVDSQTKVEDLARPGHIFPLIAKPNGLRERTGHTEATVELARLAGFEPAGVLIEILNEDGTMARLPELKDIAQKHNLKITSIQEIIDYLNS